MRRRELHRPTEVPLSFWDIRRGKLELFARLEFDFALRGNDDTGRAFEPKAGDIIGRIVLDRDARR